jgi:hypothetical protein
MPSLCAPGEVRFTWTKNTSLKAEPSLRLAELKFELIQTQMAQKPMLARRATIENGVLNKTRAAATAGESTARESLSVIGQMACLLSLQMGSIK